MIVKLLSLLHARADCRYPFSPEQPIPLPDWERYCGSVVQDVMTEQSPKQLLAVRTKLYQLLINCIPASVVMKVGKQALLPFSAFACTERVPPNGVDSLMMFASNRCVRQWLVRGLSFERMHAHEYMRSNTRRGCHLWY